MKKLEISEELVKRVECAAKNGSKVANIIVKEIKKGRNDISKIFPENSKANYFASKRVVYNNSAYKKLSIQISCCNKDVNNERFPDKGNPNSTYFKENRTPLQPSSFANCFCAVQDAINKGLITSDDLTFFDSAIRVSSKVTIKLSNKMYDIERAYDASNYSEIADSTESNLHGSCMRHNDGSHDQSRNAADFYANFCGASILYAQDEDGNILGRAIVWRNIDSDYFEGKLSLLDRIYFCFDFVRAMMIKWATDNGIMFMKNRNTYDSQTEWRTLQDVTNITGEKYVAGTSLNVYATIKVPQVKWHKKGAPYCDTFYKLYKIDDTLIISNKKLYGEYNLAEFRSTSGYADIYYKICPICGKVHSNSYICDDCSTKYRVETVMGQSFVGIPKSYKGKLYPKDCFVNGKPSKALKLFEMVQRLFQY